MTAVAGATALVVGGGSGMGRSIALTLARAGAAVHVADVNTARVASVGDELDALGSHGLRLRCDVRDDASVEELAARVEAAGPVDILVCMPGMAVSGPPDRIAIGDWRDLLELNVLGTIRVVNAVVPNIAARRRGHVVLTGSEAGFVPHSAGLGAYAASKAAINAFAESLALYLRPNGVGVSLLAPGLVLSNFGESARLSGTSNPAWFDVGDARAISPDEVGPRVVDAILSDRFLVLTHDEFAGQLVEHAESMDAALAAREARLRPPPDPSA